PAGRYRAVPPIPPPDGKTVDPEGESAERVDHQVHARCMRGILGTAQRRLDEHKPSLHEHDQEAGDQRPYIVDRVQIVDTAVRQISRLELIGNVALAIARRRRPDAGRTTD